MLKIFKKKYFLFQSCENKHKKNTTRFSPYPLGKTRKGQYLIGQYIVVNT